MYGSVQDFTIDQAAGAIALSLGALGSLLRSLSGSPGASAGVAVILPVKLHKDFFGPRDSDSGCPGVPGVCKLPLTPPLKTHKDFLSRRKGTPRGTPIMENYCPTVTVA